MHLLLNLMNSVLLGSRICAHTRSLTRLTSGCRARSTVPVRIVAAAAPYDTAPQAGAEANRRVFAAYQLYKGKAAGAPAPYRTVPKNPVEGVVLDIPLQMGAVYVNQAFFCSCLQNHQAAVASPARRIIYDHQARHTSYRGGTCPARDWRPARRAKI